MTPRLPSMTAAELVRILERRGFERVRQSGSHLILRHMDGRRVTVPMHKSKDLGRGLLARIMKDADLTIEDLGSPSHELWGRDDRVAADPRPCTHQNSRLSGARGDNSIGR